MNLTSAVLITIVVLGVATIAVGSNFSTDADTVTSLLYFYSTIPQVVVATYALFLVAALPHLDRVLYEIDREAESQEQDREERIRQGKSDLKKLISNSMQLHKIARTGERILVSLKRNLFHAFLLTTASVVMLPLLDLLSRSWLLIALTIPFTLYFAKVMCDAYVLFRSVADAFEKGLSKHTQNAIFDRYDDAEELGISPGRR